VGLRSRARQLVYILPARRKRGRNCYVFGVSVQVDKHWEGVAGEAVGAVLCLSSGLP
jgi:hypothetical protein